MDDDSIENSATKIQSKTSSRPRDRSRDRKHKKRSSSSRSSRSSSSSRSRERSSKRRRDDRKKRSSKYSSDSDSYSSSSSSRSRSSSSSRSRSRSNSLLRQKIKRRSNFDDERPSGNTYPKKFTENRSISSSNNNNFNQYSGGGGALRVSDIIQGRGPGIQPSSFMNKPKFGSGDDRHAKKLYFGNLPQNINEQDFIEYIYRSLELAGGVMQPGNPITGIKYEPEKNYIFLDFRSIEETSACLQLDGITYHGKVLRIKRPKQYDLMPKPENTRPVPILDLMKLGTRFVSPKVDNSSTKVFVGGIPHNMDESAIIEILMRAGPLKSFHLVKDKANISKGFGFCEYHTEQDVAKCIETLNGLPMGHQRILQVKRAFNLSERDFLGPSSNAASNLARNFLDMFNSASNPQAAAFQQQPPLGQFGNFQNNDFNNMNTVANPMGNIQPQVNEAPPVVEEKATNVICISNMVDPNELEDDAEFEDIYEDIKNEVIRFGSVRSILIPRKKDGYDGPCLGKVYIEYEDAKSAISAKSVLKTYKFGGNSLDPIYYEPNQFMERILL